MTVPFLRRGSAVAIAALLGGALVLLAARFEPHDPQPATGPGGIEVETDGLRVAPGAPQWRSIEVSRATATERVFGDPTPARIRIDEGRAAHLGAPLSGRVREVHVDLGARVQVGDPLFTVASADVAGFRAERERARLQVAVARKEHERIAALVQAQALPAKEEIRARTELEASRLALRQAEEALAALRVANPGGNTYTVTAPRDGVVVERHLTPGLEVSPDAGPLVTIASIESVWAVADVLAADALQVGEGAAAILSIPDVPGVEIEGRVERVSAVVDPVRNTVPIRVRVGNEEGLLRPNLFVRVRFEQVAADAAVEVPATAVFTDGARQFVFVEEEEGRFARREVIARSARQGRIPIVSGVGPNESVVSRGAVLLQNHLVLHN